MTMATSAVLYDLLYVFLLLVFQDNVYSALCCLPMHALPGSPDIFSPNGRIRAVARLMRIAILRKAVRLVSTRCTPRRARRCYRDAPVRLKAKLSSEARKGHVVN